MVDRSVRTSIDVKGKPNKYGTPKDFKTKADAELYIKKHSYNGMSWKYEFMRNKEV